MKSTLKRFTLSLFLVYSIFTLGCSKATVNKVVGMLGEVPSIVASFSLPAATAERVNNVISGIRDVVSSYRDNPSNSTFTRAIDAFDAALSSNVFNIGSKAPALRGFVLAARVAFRFFGPETLAEMDESSEDGKAVKAERDKALKDLDNAFEILKDAGGQ